LIDAEVAGRVFVSDTRGASKERHTRKAEQPVAKVQHGE
jgi:hypothetical protein